VEWLFSHVLVWPLIVLQAGLTFEVASIKPNPSTAQQMVIRVTPSGGIDAASVIPRLLIRFAFSIDNSLIVGAPDWISSERYDVVARAPDGTGIDGTRAMLRALLAERFKLRTHVETREMSVYLLTTARADKRLGAQMRPTQVACVPRNPGPLSTPPAALAAPTQGMPCELRARLGHMSGGGVDTGELARSLSVAMSRIVVDRTGLIGTFDLVLNFTPEAVLFQSAQATADAVPADNAPASIFTALQDQLGLRLEAGRAPIDVLVIDTIERPTPN
jgi:uncharacterized protein (TIGR03435 family)